MESARLRLRRLTEKDLPGFVELESDPDIMKFTPSRKPWTPEQSRERLRQQIARTESDAPLGIWAAESKENGDFVGWFMLLNGRYEFPELGFMIVRRRWGKGFATEASERLLRFAFEDLKYPAVMAATDPDNEASQRVLKKLGFRFLKSTTRPDQVLGREAALHVFERKA